MPVSASVCGCTLCDHLLFVTDQGKQNYCAILVRQQPYHGRELQEMNKLFKTVRVTSLKLEAANNVVQGNRRKMFSPRLSFLYLSSIFSFVIDVQTNKTNSVLGRQSVETILSLFYGACPPNRLAIYKRRSVCL